MGLPPSVARKNWLSDESAMSPALRKPSLTPVTINPPAPGRMAWERMSRTAASLCAVKGCCPCGETSRNAWTAGSPPPESKAANTITGAAFPNGGRPRASTGPCQIQAAPAGSSVGAFKAATRSARTSTRASPAATSGASFRPSRSAFRIIAESTTGLARARSARSVHESGPATAAGVQPNSATSRKPAERTVCAAHRMSAKTATTRGPTRKTVAADRGAPYQNIGWLRSERALAGLPATFWKIDAGL